MDKKELLKITKPLIVNREEAKLLPQKTMIRKAIKQDFSTIRRNHRLLRR